MDVLLRIIRILGPLLLGTYLSTLDLSRSTKIAAWIICGIISVVAVWHWLREAARKKKKDKKQEEVDSYDRELRERTVLLLEGKPATYIDGLGESALLKHFFNEGQRYEKKYKFNEAIEEYQKCLSHPGATPENKVAANILIGNCYYAQSEFTEAQRHYKDALKICRRVKDGKEKLGGKAVALGNIGNVLFQKGDLEGALENYKKDLEISERIGQPVGMARAYGNIGIVLAVKGDVEGALENFEKAIKVFEEIGQPSRAASIYGNIGNVLFEQGYLEGALENYEKVLNIFKELGQPAGEAHTYINIANIQSQKNDYKSAALLQLRALFIYSRIGMKLDIEKTQRRLAMSVRKLKEQGKFEDFLQEAKVKFGEEVAQRIKQITG